MKVIKYKVLGYIWQYNQETEEEEQIECFSEIERPYSETNEEIAKTEALNGEYTIEDDGVEETVIPSQLDKIEAQVAYTAMMTDTLLEV